jgi:hypothetical protein
MRILIAGYTQRKSRKIKFEHGDHTIHAVRRSGVKKNYRPAEVNPAVDVYKVTHHDYPDKNPHRVAQARPADATL